MKNIINIVTIILPSLFIFSICTMELLIDTNIKGTTAVNNKLINISPKGFNTDALSLKIIPIILPIITPDKRSIGNK